MGSSDVSGTGGLWEPLHGRKSPGDELKMQHSGVIEARALTNAVSDRDLLRAVRGGDLEVFDVLWNRYQSQMLGYAAKRLPIQQAEDAISIVMEATLRALISGKGPEQFFRAYVFQSLRREIGRQRAESELNQVAEHEQLDRVAPVRHEPQRAEVGMLVKDILGSFSTSDRLLLTLNLEEGRRIAEIAMSLGLAPENASQQLYRAKNEFKSRWFAAHLDLSGAPELCRTTLADAPYAMGRRHKPGRAKKFWSHVESCSFCGPRVREAQGTADRLVVLFPAAFAAFAWAEPGALVVHALQPTGRVLDPSALAALTDTVAAALRGAKVGAGAGAMALVLGTALLLSGVLTPAQAELQVEGVAEEQLPPSATAAATAGSSTAPVPSVSVPPSAQASSVPVVTAAQVPPDGAASPEPPAAPTAAPSAQASASAAPTRSTRTPAPTRAPAPTPAPTPTQSTTSPAPVPAPVTGRKPCSWGSDVSCYAK